MRRDQKHFLFRVFHGLFLSPTRLVNFEGDEFHSATAKGVEEAQKLVEVGFEYRCDFNEVKVFRKRTQTKKWDLRLLWWSRWDLNSDLNGEISRKTD